MLGIGDITLMKYYLAVTYRNTNQHVLKPEVSKLSVKGQIVNIEGYFTWSLLKLFNSAIVIATRDNVSEWAFLYSNKPLFIGTGSGPDLAQDHHLLV